MRNEGIPQTVRKKIMGHNTDSMDQRYGIIDLADVEFVRKTMNSATASKTASLGSQVGDAH